MSTIKLISRKEAKEQGLTRFFTGLPCKQNHIDNRLTSSGECLMCKRVREERKYKEDPSRHKQQYLKNRDVLLQKQKIRDDARRDKKILYGRQWRAINTHYAKQYRKTKAGLYAYHTSLRRKRCQVATPKWADLAAIRAIYLECEQITKSTGIEHHVDHIIPLKGRRVSGLHIHTNLQIIQKTENLSKRNAFVVS